MGLTQQILTLEQFLALPETKPASEYWDGKIFQKPMPMGKHSMLQSAWTRNLDERSRRSHAGLALPELRCTFAGRCLVPDVAYVVWSRIPRDASGEIANEFRFAPDLAIEVVSPEQSLASLRDKLTFCVQNGVRLGLLVDSEAKAVTLFRPDRPLERLTAGPFSLEPVIEGLAFTVEEVFGWLVP